MALLMVFHYIMKALASHVASLNIPVSLMPQLRIRFVPLKLLSRAVFFLAIIIHLKKLLGSDWLKRSAFLVNIVQKRVTVQKSETRVQITTKISEVKTKTAGGQPMYFEDRRRLCETFRRFPKTVWSLPKTTEDHTKPSEDFRRSPEHFRMFSKITRTLPKFSEDCPNTSEDHPNTSEDRPNTFDNLRTLHFRSFSKC